MGKLDEIRNAAAGLIFVIILSACMMLYFSAYTTIPMEKYTWWGIILVSPAIGNLLDKIF